MSPLSNTPENSSDDGYCDLCHQMKKIQWDPKRNSWVCDECDAKYFCVECGENVLPEDVSEEVPFGLYLGIMCKSCAKQKKENKNQ